MNQRNQNHSSTAFWTVTGITGAVATAAVTVIMGSVMSAPAHSAPAVQMPAGPESVSSVTGETAAGARYCFRGQQGWHHATAAPPDCRR